MAYRFPNGLSPSRVALYLHEAMQEARDEAVLGEGAKATNEVRGLRPG